MVLRIKNNKNHTEVIKSIYDYRMQVRLRNLEKKVNKLYKFGFIFWSVLGIIILFFILMAML